MSTGDPPKSIDLSHHLSDVAKARRPSPLKTLAKYLYNPGLIPLAGGSYLVATGSAEKLTSASLPLLRRDAAPLILPILLYSR